MSKLKISATISIGLGILSVIAILMCHLALTDIWHSEGDLTLEWRVLQFGFLAIILFHVSAFVTLFHVVALFKKPDTAAGAEHLGVVQ
jgi:hypothetical protein